MLIPLTISLGLIYLLYRGFSQVTTDSLLAVLPFFILLLVLIIPVSLMTLAFALAIYQCRSHQEKIPFREIQNIELETVPGVTRRLSSLTITTANRTYNITPTKNFSDENLQIFNRD
jgi:hypothetical protein